jgi:hypothetical protein
MRPGPRSRDGHPLVRPRTRRRHRRHRPTARRRAITAPPHQGAAAVPPPAGAKLPAPTRGGPGPSRGRPRGRNLGSSSLMTAERLARLVAPVVRAPAAAPHCRLPCTAVNGLPAAFAASPCPPGPDPGGRDLGGPRVSAPIDLRVLKRSALRMQPQRELGGRPRGTPSVGGPPRLPTRLRTGARRDDGSLRTRPGWDEGLTANHGSEVPSYTLTAKFLHTRALRAQARLAERHAAAARRGVRT